jgi:hypothetical protein
MVLQLQLSLALHWKWKNPLVGLQEDLFLAVMDVGADYLNQIDFHY